MEARRHRQPVPLSRRHQSLHLLPVQIVGSRTGFQRSDLSARKDLRRRNKGQFLTPVNMEMTMRKSAYFALIALTLLSIFSCRKYLDQKPDNLLTEDQIWQTRANAEAYLYNIYSQLHNSDGGDYASMGASDESSVCIAGTLVRQMVAGNWNASSNYFYNWASYYSAIRETIIFEQNIGKVPATQLSDSLKTQYTAEVQFL